MDKKHLTELLWKAEIVMASKCWLAGTLAKDEGKEYECNCEDIYEMSEKELFEYLDKNSKNTNITLD